MHNMKAAFGRKTLLMKLTKRFTFPFKPGLESALYKAKATTQACASQAWSIWDKPLHFGGPVKPSHNRCIQQVIAVQIAGTKGTACWRTIDQSQSMPRTGCRPSIQARPKTACIQGFSFVQPEKCARQNRAGGVNVFFFPPGCHATRHRTQLLLHHIRVPRACGGFMFYPLSRRRSVPLHAQACELAPNGQPCLTQGQQDSSRCPERDLSGVHQPGQAATGG